MSKILIITDVLPSDSHTAGIMLEQIISHISDTVEISTFCVHSDGISTYPVSGFINGRMTWTRKPQEYRTSTFAIGRIIELLHDIEVKDISRAIIREISQAKPDEILFVVQGVAMMKIALKIRESEIEFKSVHWDPLSWWVVNHKMSSRNLRLIETYKKQIANSSVQILPSHKFASYLELKNDNFFVIQLAHKNFFHKDSIYPNKIRLCFAGQNYASKEMQFFTKVLDSINWVIDGKKVELHIFGNINLEQQDNIVNHGWIAPSELIKQLSNYDGALLPYPSSEEKKETAKFSFPSKFSTYISAGLPVIFIAGDYHPLTEDMLSVSRVVKVGNQGELLESVRRISEFKKQSKTNLWNLFENHFTEGVQRETVRRIFPTDELILDSENKRRRINVTRSSRDGYFIRKRDRSLTLGNYLSKILVFPATVKLTVNFFHSWIKKMPRKAAFSLSISIGFIPSLLINIRTSVGRILARKEF